MTATVRIVRIHFDDEREAIVKELPAPHNGPCDRCSECHYVSARCREGLSDYPTDWTDWESTPLPAAPNRRWLLCAGWPLTLGMVFDKRSGRCVYPGGTRDE